MIRVFPSNEVIAMSKKTTKKTAGQRVPVLRIHHMEDLRLAKGHFPLG